MDKFKGEKMKKLTEKEVRIALQQGFTGETLDSKLQEECIGRLKQSGLVEQKEFRILLRGLEPFNGFNYTAINKSGSIIMTDGLGHVPKITESELSFFPDWVKGFAEEVKE